ncbi:hypothetical protein Tco_0549354 [Tanacetum coccineum]
MSGTLPPIPPPFGTSFGNPDSPNVNRVDMMPTATDLIYTTTTTNVSQSEKVNRTFTRLKYLLNGLENNGVTIPQTEVNSTFVNSLPRKWLSMNQTQRANNSIKNDCLATLYSKYKYKEDVKGSEDTNEFMARFECEYHERVSASKAEKDSLKRSGGIDQLKFP